MNWGQAIADAIALGALYGVVAVGIGLVFGVMRLINFAYGELRLTLGPQDADDTDKLVAAYFS